MLAIYYLLAALLGFMLLLTLVFGLAILLSGNGDAKLDTIFMIVTAVIDLLVALAFRWVLVTILAMPNIKVEIDSYTLYSSIVVVVSYLVFIATGFLASKSKFYHLMLFTTWLTFSAFVVARIISFMLG